MSSRQELKAQRRREREAAERAAAKAERRRLLLVRIATGVVVVSVVAVVAVLIVSSDGSESSSGDFGANPDGLVERVERAGLTPGNDHFHPTVRVYASGEEIPIPEDLGTSSDGAHVGVHKHPGDPQVHAEGVKAGTFTLSQLMAVWGVPFGEDRLGPYRADGQREVTVFVKDSGETSFEETDAYGDLKLSDGQEVYVVYGTAEQSPIRQ